jgi:hypothetical protein
LLSALVAVCGYKPSAGTAATPSAKPPAKSPAGAPKGR